MARQAVPAQPLPVTQKDTRHGSTAPPTPYMYGAFRSMRNPNAPATSPSAIAQAVGLTSGYPGQPTSSQAALRAALARQTFPDPVARGATSEGRTGTFSPAANVQQSSLPDNTDLGVMGGGSPGQQLNQSFTTSGTPTAGSIPSVGTDPSDWTFNGGPAYSNRDLEALVGDPLAFQQEYLKSIGMGTPAANAALGPYSQRLNPLSIALYGGAGGDAGAQSDIERLAGSYQALLSNYITPGARMPDVAEIANILLGSPNIANGGAATNPLQAYIGSGDPASQAQAVNSILGASLAGMPGAWGTAWSNMLDQAANNYLTSTYDAYNGPGSTYVDYLNADPFWSQFGG